MCTARVGPAAPQGFTYIAPGLLDSAVSEAVLLEQAASAGARSQRGGAASEYGGDDAAAGVGVGVLAARPACLQTSCTHLCALVPALRCRGAWLGVCCARGLFADGGGKQVTAAAAASLLLPFCQLAGCARLRMAACLASPKRTCPTAGHICAHQLGTMHELVRLHKPGRVGVLWSLVTGACLTA